MDFVPRSGDDCFACDASADSNAESGLFVWVEVVSSLLSTFGMLSSSATSPVAGKLVEYVLAQVDIVDF